MQASARSLNSSRMHASGSGRLLPTPVRRLHGARHVERVALRMYSHDLSVFQAHDNANISLNDIQDCFDATRAMRPEDRRQYFMSVGINYDNVIKYYETVRNLSHTLEMTPFEGDGSAIYVPPGIVGPDVLLGLMREQVIRAVITAQHSMVAHEDDTQHYFSALTGDALSMVKQQLSRAMALPSADAPHTSHHMHHLHQHQQMAGSHGSVATAHSTDLLGTLRSQAPSSMYAALMILSMGVMFTVRR